MVMQKFSLREKNIFDKAYRLLEIPLAEHSFAWIYLWDYCYKDIELEMINENLCLFLTFEGKRYIWGPILPGNKIADTLKKCFSLCENYNVYHHIDKKPSVLYIPEELKEKYSSLEGFKVREQNSDYIYKTRDIIELSGKKYQDKRNKRNFFIKNYDSTVEEYSVEKHKNMCVDLLERWEKQKESAVKEGDRKKFEADIEASRRAFDFAKILRIKGMVVLISGKVEGYIFGVRTNEKICTMFLGKTNLDIKGLSQFIYSEFLKRYFKDAELVNDGEDWDVSYLENSKLSYKPVFIKKSYMLVLDGV